MRWLEHQLDRLRALDPRLVDGTLAVLFAVLGVVTVHTQQLEGGLREPPPASLLTILVVALPIAARRRWPLAVLVVACVGVVVHVLAEWPEGALPLAAMLLTYGVAVWGSPRRAVAGLAAVYLSLIVLGVADTPGLDALGVVGNIGLFTVAWTGGIALRARRAALDAQLREADERADAERERAARTLAEERLRIAQELHDVVAHSMSVIAVQAGAGAHVAEEHPEQARAALEAISTTSRSTLTELRRLLGVLRDGDAARTHAPAPGLADVPGLVEQVQAAGVPVTLRTTGLGGDAPLSAGIELSVYRVVQEALTNVMKHAGSPSRVDVSVHRCAGALEVEVVDDGRGAAGRAAGDAEVGHGLLGMRERVELWGGELTAGPSVGGGYCVRAVLPVGETP